MSTFSVIVPVYHGTQYIEGIIKQAEENAKKLGEEAQLELLFINDDPLESLPQGLGSDLVSVVTLDTDVNRGIHGARVRGLELCRGEYVLFLDQDDKIAPDYLYSQIRCIGDHAGVVCQVIHEKKRYYNAEYPFEKMMTKEYMLSKGSPIVSPGQVLLRKEAISATWKKEIMTYNGADDFLLWLCMAAEGKSFALNSEILFEHVAQYDNASWNSYNMMRSEAEMTEISMRSGLFSVEDTAKLENMLRNIQKKRLDNLDKFRKMFYTLKDLSMAEADGNGVSGFLERKKLCNVAVYGGGYLGKYLLKKLERSRVKVRYIIDQNAAYLDLGYPAYTIEDKLEDVDAVIVTLVQNEQDVISRLKLKLRADVFTIKELAYGLGKEERYGKDFSNHTCL